MELDQHPSLYQESRAVCYLLAVAVFLLKCQSDITRFVEPSAEIQEILNVPHKDWDVGRDGKQAKYSRVRAS
jgi:hypothetical protein